MSFWPELVDAAVLGAGRSAPPTPTPPIADLGAAPAGPDDQDWREGTGLLHWAAVASRSRRAGYLPTASAEQRALEPAAADWRPPVRPAARQRLRALLDGDQTELVSEWLRLLASTGRRPPDALLPLLLDLATSDKELRRLLAPALGPLATWLAAANPAWAWAATARPMGHLGRQNGSSQPHESGPADESSRPDEFSPADEESVRTAWRRTWTTGSHRARRELLDWVRHIDASAGRDLVAATWSGDSARDRATFIAGLVTGLSPADEPLLDQALADRSAEVSRAAAGLLCRLPGSAYAVRAGRRAASAVQVRDTAAGLRLEVAPPAEGDAELAADGVDASSPRGIGRQAWLLQQIVAAPAARWWAEHTGLPPGDLLELAASTDWAAPLQAGWADAAIRDAHLPWIGAFLDLPSGRLERMGDGTAISLFRALTDADREGWLAARPDSPLFGAAELVPGPWSARLSATARDRIVALATADSGHSPQAYRLLRVAAMRLDPPVPLELDPAQVHPRLADRWAELTSTLSVRAAMRRELAEEPAP